VVARNSFGSRTDLKLGKRPHTGCLTYSSGLKLLVEPKTITIVGTQLTFRDEELNTVLAGGVPGITRIHSPF
jgi:hypothetical protein